MLINFTGQRESNKWFYKWVPSDEIYKMRKIKEETTKWQDTKEEKIVVVASDGQRYPLPLNVCKIGCSSDRGNARRSR